MMVTSNADTFKSLGNKYDLDAKREVSTELAEEFATST